MDTVVTGATIHASPLVRRRCAAPLAVGPTPVDLVRMVALGVLCFLVAIAIATR